MVSINDVIPPELIISIIYDFHIGDLETAMQVCKLWYTLGILVKNKRREVVFVCDRTKSMEKHWGYIQKQLSDVHIDFKTRYGFVCFYDHKKDDNDGQLVTMSYDLSYNLLNQYREEINILNYYTGYDIPEAILDGLSEALNMKWRSVSSKKIILFTDSHPHGEKYGSKDDDFKDGCPCGISDSQLLKDIQEKNITLYVIYFSERSKKMCDVFKEFMPSIQNIYIDPADKNRFTSLISNIINGGSNR